jgi:hypothetical protein
MRRELRAVALAGLLVLAGCSSAVAPGGSGSGTPTDGDVTTSGTGTTSGAGGTGSGTVSLYVSDERNAIGDFEHLNVTVEGVSFRRAGDDGNATTGTEAPEPAETTETGSDDVESDDRTGIPERNGTAEAGNGTGTTDLGSDDGDEGDGGDGEWITREVSATTVDLTDLRGENATMLSRFDLPNGTYTRVRLHVAAVDGTLTSGEHVRVKLPSERLRVDERFAVGDGDAVDFVFDATVFEAGESGKYVLKPVASESGTDVPIREVALGGDRGGDLGARFLGTVNPGEAATVRVTRDGRPVSGATVEVGDRTYETGSDGTVMFDVPGGAEELEAEIDAGDAETDLKRTFDGGPGNADGGRDDGPGDGERDATEDGSGGTEASGGADGTTVRSFPAGGRPVLRTAGRPASR